MMYEQALDAVKGWFHMSALDKSANLAAELRADSTVNLPAGRVVHLDANGEFYPGGVGHEMPIFLWTGRDDADVYNDGTSTTTGVVHWISLQKGTMNGLVATGGYELQSTEFDDEQDYAVNDLLTATISGVITNEDAVQYVNWICGVCSTHVNADNQSVALGVHPAAVGPVGYNANGVQTLTFWAYFLPGGVASVRVET
jgi:hypothetical protein